MGTSEMLETVHEDWKPFEKRYELGSFLGKGGFGYVWECRDRASGEDCACKVFDKTSVRTKEEAAALQREVLVLRALRGQSKGVVQLREVLQGQRTTWLVMEKCKGGDMFELICRKGRLPETSAKVVFKQLAAALRLCHSLGIVHRDVKLENILFNQPASRLYDDDVDHGMPPILAKLADFGLAIVLQPGDTTTGHIGTRFYTAPEILQGRPYGRRVDVWSLGVVLCAMLTARLPFTGKNKADHHGLKKQILKGRVDFSNDIWSGVSEDAKDLVCRMLAVDPKCRIKACEILVHPWLSSAATPPVRLSPALSVHSTQSAEFPAPSKGKIEVLPRANSSGGREQSGPKDGDEAQSAAGHKKGNKWECQLGKEPVGTSKGRVCPQPPGKGPSGSNEKRNWFRGFGSKGQADSGSATVRQTSKHEALHEEARVSMPERHSIFGWVH